jgi:hypothetical protein
MNVAGVCSYPMQGLQAATAGLNKSAEALASGDLDSGNVIGMIDSKNAAEANIAVLKAGDQMIGTLLDVLA